MRFVTESSDLGQFDLVVNNHVDVDGVLCTFVLLEPELAARSRETLVQAAEMGDFWGYGSGRAAELYQGLSRDMARLAGEDPQTLYERCFERVRSVLSGHDDPENADGLAALRRSLSLLETGQVERTELAPHLVHYRIPRRLAEQDMAAALRVVPFNRPLSNKSLLLPHARAHRDAQKLQLVSVETTSGFHYDLHYPGYTWAETCGLWRPPGVQSTGSSNEHRLDYPPLDVARAALAAEDQGDGRWAVAKTLSPFATLPGRGFPVVLTSIAGDASGASALNPARVERVLAETLGGVT